MILTRKDYKKLEKKIEKLEKKITELERLNGYLEQKINNVTHVKSYKVEQLEIDIKTTNEKIKWIIPLVISITALGIAVCALL